MIDIFGSAYYIDLDVIDKMVTINNPMLKTKKNKGNDDDDNTEENMKTIDGVKYEMISQFINVIMEPVITDEEDMDNTLGFDRNMDKMSIGFKLAFNTLYKYNILKELK